MGGQVNLFFVVPSLPSTSFSLEPCLFSDRQVTRGDLQNHDLTEGQVNLLWILLPPRLPDLTYRFSFLPYYQGIHCRLQNDDLTQGQVNLVCHASLNV